VMQYAWYPPRLAISQKSILTTIPGLDCVKIPSL
jgi:hypothetical protein